MITDYKKWIAEDPDKKDIAYLDAEQTITYLPIEVVQRDLDLFNHWDTKRFNFQIYRLGEIWVASASLQLTVSYWETVIKEGEEHHKNYVSLTRVGSATFRISSESSNQHFEATANSLCILNAAKKLGNRFGRKLNSNIGDEMDVYKTVSQPVVLTTEQQDFDKLLSKCKTLADLSHFNGKDYKHMRNIFNKHKDRINGKV